VHSSSLLVKHSLKAKFKRLLVGLEFEGTSIES